MFNTLEVKWDPIIPFDPEYRDKCLQEQPHAQNIMPSLGSKSVNIKEKISLP